MELVARPSVREFGRRRGGNPGKDEGNSKPSFFAAADNLLPEKWKKMYPKWKRRRNAVGSANTESALLAPHCWMPLFLHKVVNDGNQNKWMDDEDNGISLLLVAFFGFN